MRILFVADAASIHTRRWLEHFSAQGHEVHVASFREYVLPGVTTHMLQTFGLGKIGYFYALLELPKIFTKVRPELVHAHYLTSYGFLAAFAGLRPLIVTAWGSDALLAPRQSRIMRYFASYAVRHANLVTTLANHMNPAVANLGVSLNNIIATPFGVDTDLFKLLPKGTKNEIIKIICTRNFFEIYDISTLIFALKKLLMKGHRLQLDLIGDGPLKSSLSDLSDKLDIGPYVKFHGHLDHKMLASMLASADIFVSPAISDGNNVSLNEAMACGCFPIATDIPANLQWIEHGRNGYLYPPKDVSQLAQAIEDSIDNFTLRDNARILNRQIAETIIDWRICTHRMEMLYKKVIDRVASK